MKNNWPGPARESAENRKKLGVEDVTVTKKQPKLFAEEVKEACRSNYEMDMKREIEDKVKSKTQHGR